MMSTVSPEDVRDVITQNEPLMSFHCSMLSLQFPYFDVHPIAVHWKNLFLLLICLWSPLSTQCRPNSMWNYSIQWCIDRKERKTPSSSSKLPRCAVIWPILLSDPLMSSLKHPKRFFAGLILGDVTLEVSLWLFHWRPHGFSRSCLSGCFSQLLCPRGSLIRPFIHQTFPSLLFLALLERRKSWDSSPPLREFAAPSKATLCASSLLSAFQLINKSPLRS